MGKEMQDGAERQGEATVRRAPQEFATTRWTLIFSAADPEARSAREEFARLYWRPLYLFARLKRLSAEDAEDAVQSFLSQLLNSPVLPELSKSRGRFRSFLRVAMDHYLIDEFRRQHAQRRRPAAGLFSMDFLQAEREFTAQPIDAVTPELAFDRQCARALLDAALNDLRKEYDRAGRLPLFEHLSRMLDGAPDRETHDAASQRLGMEESSLRNAAWRFRKRFSELFRNRVSATVDDSNSIDDEIQSLKAALARC